MLLIVYFFTVFFSSLISVLHYKANYGDGPKASTTLVKIEYSFVPLIPIVNVAWGIFKIL